MNEQLVSERSGLAEVLRQEFADRLAASEEETRQARAQLEQLTQEKQAELEEVHGRWAVGWSRGVPEGHGGGGRGGQSGAGILGEQRGERWAMGWSRGSWGARGRGEGGRVPQLQMTGPSA